MKLSMKMLPVAETDREAIGIIKNAGFDGIDFSFCKNMNDREKFLSREQRQELLHLAAEIHAQGLEIPQCHLPYLPGHVAIESYETFEEKYLPMFVRSLELCAEIACPVAVIHLYFEKNAAATYAGNLRLMRKLLPYLEKYNVTLAIENIYGGGSAYEDCHISRPEDILRYVEEMNHPKIGICLDTGHANILRENAVEMARMYGSHLVATHIHSNGGQDQHLIPGMLGAWQDGTDYHALATVFRDIGYTGSFNLELVLPPIPQTAYKTFVQLAYDAAAGFIS